MSSINTIAEAIDQLPAEIRDRARANAKVLDTPYRTDKPYQVLLLAFTWSESKEGIEYWATAYNKLEEEYRKNINQTKAA